MPPSRWRCLINGEARADVDSRDRGLSYGDGLFETIAVRSGRPCCWLDHLDRLALGAARLRLPLPSPARLKAEAARLVEGVEVGTLKMIITRGPSARGYRLPAQPQPTRILFVDERLDDQGHAMTDPSRDPRTEQGVQVRLCDTRLGLNPQLAGLKHLNRLEQVLARAEWADPGIDEGLMLDAEGALVCGTMSNLILITDVGLETPLIDRCGVAGTARAQLLRIAVASGYQVRERRLGLDDLLRAQGALLTNALVGIWPIRSFEGQEVDLSGLPWPLIEQVQTRLMQPESDW
ncbi:MAG: aminodeoxychorismate lyase [Lamprobacter sp.]|uniref:aminodeoxychorismate lyase n=1 Tax=Lamprobacter sp. TaxID=3100796 RepID=UPI002B25F503|nr:aminodeoxychorismate lyase [Lamprobacter sp.]MEA3638572.1 aminodeoxychorismate lyase [Lamprobacter sp.]